MGSVARLARKLRPSPRNFLLSAPVLRFSSSAPETCELSTFHGIRRFDGRRWVPLADHMRRFPILMEVPSNRLIDKIDPSRPYLTTEQGRDFSRRAALVPYVSHKHGKSIVGSFVDGNVGILRGTNTVVFRKLVWSDLDPTSSTAGYNEVGEFLTKLIKQQHGQWAVDHLNLDYDDWLLNLKAKTIKDEDDLVFDGSLLPDNVRAQVQFETYRLVKKEFPSIGKVRKAKRIIKDISSRHINYKQICGNNALLDQWMYHKRGNLAQPQGQPGTPSQQHIPPPQPHGQPVKPQGQLGTPSQHHIPPPQPQGQPAKPQGKLGTPPQQHMVPPQSMGQSGKGKLGIPPLQQSRPRRHLRKATRSKKTQKGKVKGKKMKRKAKTNIRGRGIIDLMRHAIIHPIEQHIVALIHKFSPDAVRSLVKRPYEVKDVIQLLHYLFPRFIPTALKAFKDHKAGRKFGIKRMFKIPEIFYA